MHQSSNLITSRKLREVPTSADNPSELFMEARPPRLKVADESVVKSVVFAVTRCMRTTSRLVCVLMLLGTRSPANAPAVAETPAETGPPKPRLAPAEAPALAEIPPLSDSPAEAETPPVRESPTLPPIPTPPPALGAVNATGGFNCTDGFTVRALPEVKRTLSNPLLA